MRVLIVTPRPPAPEGGAAARCALALVRGLGSLGVEVQVLSPRFPWQDDEVPPDVAIEHVDLPEPSAWQIRRDRLLDPGGILARGAFAARLRDRAAEADVVHFVEAEAGVGLSVVGDRPAVAQLHFASWRDRAPAPVWRRDGRIAMDLARMERRTLRRARWLLVNAPEVAAAIAPVAPHAHITVAPLALDPRHYAAEGVATLDAPVAGLIGTARWPPTTSAVERLRDIWPRVRERVPGARLLLAGDGMQRSAFPAFPDLEGVEWLGRVPSAADFLRGLGVLLYPLTAGSGTKVKVLESLALGIPVVTTPDGAEGIFAAGGLRVESEDERLVAAAAELLGDVELRRAEGRAALATFEDHHRPVPAARPVLALYERVARAPTVPVTGSG